MGWFVVIFATWSSIVQRLANTKPYRTFWNVTDAHLRNSQFKVFNSTALCYNCTIALVQLCHSKFNARALCTKVSVIFLDRTLSLLTLFWEKFTKRHSIHCMISFISIVMGKAEGHGENWHGHVTALTVSPDYRRLGLAATLMNFLENVSEK